MQKVGDAYHKAGVAAIYLVHGTFVGSDALGLLDILARLSPEMAEFASTLTKATVDRIAGDGGNYTEQFAQTLESALNSPGRSSIPVRRFFWSSENCHIGRADGAVELIHELESQQFRPGERVLLWGHSHAGNVFALVTNLLASDDVTRRKFFRAAKAFYRWPLLGKVDVPIWQQVRKLLDQDDCTVKKIFLDIVTFGTPIRYGWDTDGYAQLLNFVNHHPVEGIAEDRAPFPPQASRVLKAADGDYIQQLGIAGTNIMPSLLNLRSWWADQRLNGLLQPGLSSRDLLKRLYTGCRVPEEGETLLVDYGPPPGNIGEHMAGHAVYTRQRWMLFHAEEVARRLYQEAVA